MSFSLFKKDDKSRRTPAVAHQSARSKRGLAPSGASASRQGVLPATDASLETQDAARETARSAALATAAKIDAIESAMENDFLPQTRNPEPADPFRDDAGFQVAEIIPDTIRRGIATTHQSADAGSAQSTAFSGHADDNFDPGTDVLAGSMQAIKVDHNDKLAVLDETAILFANGRDLEAESGLRTALADEALGSATERGWLMLLELLMQRGNQMDFLQLSGHYSARFGLPGPQWLGTAGAPVTPASPTAAMPFIALPPVIDANIVRALESFKGLATQHPVLGLDLSATQSVDLVGAELLLRVIHAFRRASHQLHLRGIDALLPALQRLTIPGERAPTDAAWMLLLEVFRLLQRQHDFEETGIQYCITFEVSPPSWEPPLNNIRIETTAATALGSTTGNDPLNWRGDIVGDGQIHANALLHAGTKHTRVIVECRHLRRFSFSAGPAVLGALMRLQTQGVHVEFRDVNCLVAALWQLLGISPAADVRVRRT